MKRKYKNLTILLVCLVVLKIAFAFLGNRYSISDSFISDLFTSVLNTENIVSLTNASRKNAGLKELRISPELEKAAEQKARDMLNNQYFAHITPANKTPWDFMKNAGYSYLFAGENLAINFNSAEEVLTGWLTSPEHKENILSNKYSEIGIGLAKGKFLGSETVVVVQMFGKPLRSSALVGKLSTVQPKPKKILAAAKHKALLAKAYIKPAVKGISVENYIAELQDKKLAVWNPDAKIHQIYSVPEKSVPAKAFLDVLYSYIAACFIGIILYRYFKERNFQDKILSVFTAFIIVSSIVLAIF